MKMVKVKSQREFELAAARVAADYCQLTVNF